jgi:FKBP-type peptidyl-prolyl cis-trans isomerase FklB
LNRRLLQSALLFSLLALTTSLVAQNKNSTMNDAERASYSIGLQIGNDLKKENIPLNEEILRRGIDDGLYDKPPLVPAREMNSRLIRLKKSITTKMKEESLARLEQRRQIEQKRIADGKAFMQQNAKKDGVVTLESGLQYRVIKSGAGASPKLSDNVEVQYRARTVDGREFDSSFKLGKPVIFRADNVLPGFSEVIQLMRPGAKWEVVLPPNLAYGRKGLMANQTIILELDLLSIQPADKTQAGKSVDG